MRDEVAALLARRRGDLVGVARELEVAPGVLARLLAGGRVHRGSLALLYVALERRRLALGEPPTEPTHM